MASNEQPKQTDQPAPENPGAEAKSETPDPNTTDPATLPTSEEEANNPVAESKFADEHHINRQHSEPTDVTDTSNDNFIDGDYIDIGGGD